MTTEKEIELLKNAVFAITGIIGASSIEAKPGMDSELIYNLSMLLAMVQHLRDDEAEQKDVQREA